MSLEILHIPFIHLISVYLEPIMYCFLKYLLWVHTRAIQAFMSPEPIFIQWGTEMTILKCFPFSLSRSLQWDRLWSSQEQTYPSTSFISFPFFLVLLSSFLTLASEVTFQINILHPVLVPESVWGVNQSQTVVQESLFLRKRLLYCEGANLVSIWRKRNEKI